VEEQQGDAARAFGVGGGRQVAVDEAECPPAHLARCARRRRRGAGAAGEVQRWEHRLDLRAPALVLRREHQPLAEAVRRLVNGEARRVGRHLEQHAARLAEVHGVEVGAVDDGRRLQAGLAHVLAHDQLRLVVGDREGHVVHGAGAARPARAATDGAYVDEATGCAVAHCVAACAAALVHGAEPQRVDQDPLRGTGVGHPQGDAVNPAHRVLAGTPPRRPTVRA
jgi:hypothetical protein